MPKISVIMPVYNSEKFLREAMDSILNQTFPDFEFIILDDGSTDSSPAIVADYDDPRIRFYQNEKNMGVAATLNRGLELATGEYIARMDADDISLPKRFEIQVKYMDGHPSISVLGSGVILFGNEIGEKRRIFETDARYAKAELVFAPCTAHPSVMVRKSVLDQYKICYFEKYCGTEDFAFWWDIAEVGEVVSLPECLLRYRVHPMQVSGLRNPSKEKVYIEFLDERFLRMGVPLSEKEKRVFFAYTCGKAGTFTSDDVLTFLEILAKVYEKNKETSYFAPNALKRKFGNALVECVVLGTFNGETKKEIFKRAKSAGILSWLGKIRLMRRM